MKILVACEESQAVTIELRKLGHEAYSADIQDCSGGHPEWHIKGDVIKLLKQKWDMIIGFPPCTFLSNAGACRLYPTKGNIDNERYLKGLQAKEFFMTIYNADCPKIVVENPVSSTVFNMPKHSQEIQPYEHGHPFTKKTRLWIKGLPDLEPTDLVVPTGPYIPAGTGRKDKSKYGSAKRAGGDSKNRSKTFPGIAKAMAMQWAGDIRNEPYVLTLLGYLTAKGQPIKCRVCDSKRYTDNINSHGNEIMCICDECGSKLGQWINEVWEL